MRHPKSCAEAVCLRNSKTLFPSTTIPPSLGPGTSRADNPDQPLRHFQADPNRVGDLLIVPAGQGLLDPTYLLSRIESPFCVKF